MQQPGSEMLRATGVVALLAIGAIHFLQIVDTLDATRLLGIAYLGLIAATVALAGWLLAANDPRAWLGAGLLGLAVITGYAFTRIIGTGFDPEDVGNWACALGLASLFVEASLVGISAYAIASDHGALRFESTIVGQRDQAKRREDEPALTVAASALENNVDATRRPDAQSFLTDLHAIQRVATTPARRGR